MIATTRAAIPRPFFGSGRRGCEPAIGRGRRRGIAAGICAVLRGWRRGLRWGGVSGCSGSLMPVRLLADRQVEGGTDNVVWAGGGLRRRRCGRRRTVRRGGEKFGQDPPTVGGVEVLGRFVEQHRRGRRDQVRAPTAACGAARPRLPRPRRRARSTDPSGSVSSQPPRPTRRNAAFRSSSSFASPRATRRLSRTVVANRCASSAKNAASDGVSSGSSPPASSAASSCRRRWDRSPPAVPRRRDATGGIGAVANRRPRRG